MTSEPRVDGVERSNDREAVDVEAYQDGGSVVLFDAENPLAWVEASRAVRLRDAT